MEDRQDVTHAPDEGFDPQGADPEHLARARRAFLAFALVLGAALTYMEMYNRFAP